MYVASPRNEQDNEMRHCCCEHLQGLLVLDVVRDDGGQLLSSADRVKALQLWTGQLCVAFCPAAVLNLSDHCRYSTCAVSALFHTEDREACITLLGICIHYGNGDPPEVFSGMLKQGELC